MCFSFKLTSLLVKKSEIELMCSFLLPQEPDVEKLEKKINCGQIEEVIFQVSP